MEPLTKLRLEQLSRELLETLSQGLSEEQAALLSSKWADIRELVAQNGGYRCWGSHLLRLSSDQKEALRAVAAETVHSIETASLDLEQLFFSRYPTLAALRFLLNQVPPSKTFTFDKGAAKAVFFEYDSNRVEEHRRYFQEIFKLLPLLDTWKQRDPLVAQMFLGNLLALLPYFDFADGSTVDILRYRNGEWILVPYRVSHLSLIEHKIVAYGLESMENDVPLLIFRGTPYPAAAGFFEAMWSNVHPIRSVGEDIFLQGKPVLDAWMQGKPWVECYGLSLGGALAYHAGLAYGLQMEVNAYVAPGLTFPFRARSLNAGTQSNIRGRAFFHFNDLIPLVGTQPESEDFTIFAVMTKTHLDFIQAHARPSGIEPTIVLKVNPQHENRKRRRYIFNVVRYAFSAPLFLALLPVRLYHKLIRSVP